MSETRETCDTNSSCITCGDTAVAMRVVTVDAELGTAVCADDAGQEVEIYTVLVDPPVTAGEELLVHAGTAIARRQSGDPAGATAA